MMATANTDADYIPKPFILLSGIHQQQANRRGHQRCCERFADLCLLHYSANFSHRLRLHTFSSTAFSIELVSIKTGHYLLVVDCRSRPVGQIWHGDALVCVWSL